MPPRKTGYWKRSRNVAAKMSSEKCLPVHADKPVGTVNFPGIMGTVEALFKRELGW
ncbi:hypothetical protein LSI01_13150 [Furfurilactobacillus siliginis]|uniref:Uncharacterized protein n=1 Tax=Furfurilactobacillus siliginis TaxID=348151 RepID=A0A510VPX4_9LACO|nr:hypothetical protein LSI01_13150 [Furfurilactobacillus siliginis]